MPAVALINGVNYSWGNASLILFNVPLIGITKITLNSKQQKDNNYGAGVDPVSRGYGRKEYEGSISVYWDELKKIIDAAPNRDILDIGMFDIPMVLASTRVPFTKIVARACEFTASPFSVAEGDTKIIVDIPLVVGRIDW